MTMETLPPTAKPLAADARARMEALNAEAAHLAIWLRTQANAPAQLPWFRDTGTGVSGHLASGRVGSGQMKAVPHHWKWRDISPYLDKIARIANEADVPPVEFADRQQFLLTNPGLGGRLQVAATIRCAMSIYNPGDVARAHLHSPNASRTILSDNGGYTNVEGERCEAQRGDLILTPNGTWHDHGNDGNTPVIWIDTLDWPLMEFLDIIWLDEDLPGDLGRDNLRAQKTLQPSGYSRALYGNGGLLPGFVAHRRGFGQATSPYIHYRGADVVAALEGLKREDGDPFEGLTLAFVNPATGGPVFPTLTYGAQLLRAGQETQAKRETSSTVYVVMKGAGETEVAGQSFAWEENDVFVVPNFLWRRHRAKESSDAILYTMSDAPLLEKIGQYRAQGLDARGRIEQLVA
jgi:gentisate 1,2-dioxygenase